MAWQYELETERGMSASFESSPPAWAFEQLISLRRSRSALVDNALQRLWREDEQLRWALVTSAYLDQQVNLGKAAELLGLHELELREKFLQLGIPLRYGPATVEETEAEVAALHEWLLNDED
jgi:predicted HTH domain antitoxin